MEALPLEILHLICSHLSHRDAAALRQVNRAFSQLAAPYIVSQARFHTSAASFERLTALADHPVFRDTVRQISYEGGTIADIACHHAYMNHFPDEQHRDVERPAPPAENASDREIRLYQRNMDKFTAIMKERYAIYRKAYIEQQDLLLPKKLEELISHNLAKFTRLECIKYSPARQCSHIASRRFESEFGRECAIPISVDPKYSALQVERLLHYGNKIHPSLRKLDLEQVSPSLFTAIPPDVLQSIFKPLTSLLLSLKVNSHDFRTDADTEQAIVHHLSNNALKHALSAATELTEFAFGIHAFEACFVHLNRFLDLDRSWPKLEELTLESVISSEDSFIEFLRRQPKLERVLISHFDLNDGSWITLTDRLRKEFNFKSFEPLGCLQDNYDLYPMELLAEVAFQYGEGFSLGDALGYYISKEDSGHVLLRVGDKNPLGYIDDEFLSQEDLEEKYGKTLRDMARIHFSDSDSSSSGPTFLTWQHPDLAERSDFTDSDDGYSQEDVVPEPAD